MHRCCTVKNEVSVLETITLYTHIHAYICVCVCRCAHKANAREDTARRWRRDERVTRTEIATERNVLPTPARVKRGNGLVF